MRHLKYSLPEQISDLICAEQSTNRAADLIINGSGASIYSAEIVFKGYATTISLYSSNDNSAIVFSVYGMLNGQPVKEDILGPDDNHVYGDQLFSSITRITVNGAVDDVTVGLGNLAVFTFHPFGKAYSLSIQDINFDSEGDDAVPFLVVSSLSDIDITKFTQTTDSQGNKIIELPSNFNVIKAFNSDEFEYSYSTTDITWSVALAVIPQGANSADVVMYIAE